MDFSKLDPSLALAFYLKSRGDYEALTAALAALSSGSSTNASRSSSSSSSSSSASGSAMQVPFVVEAAPPSYECEAGMSSMLASCDTDDDRGGGGGGSGDEEEDSYVFI
jgi:hypothetical protein